MAVSLKIRRIDFSPDEWIAGTVALSNGERGLYITACALIYSHGGPIPEVELRRSCRDHGNMFNAQLGRLIALGKLMRNGFEIDQKRCRIELEKALKRSGKRAEIGDESSENNELDAPRARTPAPPRARSINHQPSKEDSDAYASGANAPSTDLVTEPVDPVKQLWDRGLAILGAKHRSLLGKMAKEYGQPAVLAAIVECEREQPVDPVAYFVVCCEGKRNGGGTPMANLFEGAWRAANALDERERREQAGDRGSGGSPPHALLVTD